MIPPLWKCQSLPGRLMRRERCAMPRHSDTVSDEITGLTPVGTGLPVFLIEDLNPASDCLSNRFGSQRALDHPRSALFLERPYQRVFRAAARHLNERVAIVSPQVRR